MWNKLQVVNIRKPLKKPNESAADSGRRDVFPCEEDEACSSTEAVRGSERAPAMVMAENRHSQAHSGVEQPGGRKTEAQPSETSFAPQELAIDEDRSRQQLLTRQQSSAAPEGPAAAVKPDLRSGADESGSGTEKRFAQANRAVTESHSEEPPVVEPSLNSSVPPSS